MANSEKKNDKYKFRKWLVPKKRAKGYAEQLKDKVHKFGNKEGQPLNEYDRGLCSGYLLCQSDHAGIFKYKKAMDEGKSKAEAIAYSRRKGR